MNYMIKISNQCSRCWTKFTFKEYLDLPSEYIYPDKKQYGKTAICSCGAKFHKDVWQLQSFEDGFRISTVHLQMPHPDNLDWSNTESCMWFETMIEDKEKDEWLGFQMRYRTMEEAIKGHWDTMDKLPRIIEKPDCYPMGIIPMFCNAMESANDMKDKISMENRKRYA